MVSVLTYTVTKVVSHGYFTLTIIGIAFIILSKHHSAKLFYACMSQICTVFLPKNVLKDEKLN